MQSYSSHPCATVFYNLINVLSSKSCPVGLLRKILEIIENMMFSFKFRFTENMIFSSIAENQENMIFTLSFLRKYCF